MVSNCNFTMAYDADDRTAIVAEPFGVLLTFAYDAGGNRSTVKDNFGGVVTTTYDALDRVVGREMGGIGVTNVRQTRSYTGTGMLAAKTDAKWTGGVWQPVVVSTHLYDLGDRVTGIMHGTGTVDGYAYDASSRLTVETINGAAKTYAYDTTDQLTNDNGSALTYDLNGNRTAAGYATGANNRMTSDGVWAYTYDAEGNVVKRSQGAAAETWVYGYDLNNRLVTAVDSATDGGAATARVTYVYDAIGNRIERLHWNGSVTVTERFAQDGWDTGKPGNVGHENFDVVLDLDGTNGLVTRRLYGDGQDDIIAKQSSVGVVTWYLTDRLGSVQSLVDNSGVSVGTLAYSAFGGTTVNTGSTDRYQYTGREADAALGLQFNRDRMYLSSSGRWLSEDPSSFSAGDPNLMRYVGNGPTNGRDPSGLQSPAKKGVYTPEELDKVNAQLKETENGLALAIQEAKKLRGVTKGRIGVEEYDQLRTHYKDDPDAKKIVELWERRNELAALRRKLIDEKSERAASELSKLTRGKPLPGESSRFAPVSEKYLEQLGKYEMESARIRGEREVERVKRAQDEQFLFDIACLFATAPLGMFGRPTLGVGLGTRQAGLGAAREGGVLRLSGSATTKAPAARRTLPGHTEWVPDPRRAGVAPRELPGLQATYTRETGLKPDIARRRPLGEISDAGFDPKTKEIFVYDDVPPAFRDGYLAEELHHYQQVRDAGHLGKSLAEIEKIDPGFRARMEADVLGRVRGSGFLPYDPRYYAPYTDVPRPPGVAGDTAR